MLLMNEDTITDLKTYMATILSQQVGGLRADIEQRFDELDSRLSAQIATVDKKLDDLSDSVGEALHNFDGAISEQRQNHEARITKLQASTV